MDATVARLRRWGASGAHFGIIIGFTVFAAFPFFWMLITTFKETRDLLKGTSKNDAVGVKLDVSRGLPDRGQA